MQPRAFLVYLAALVRAATNRPPLHKVTPPGLGHLRLHSGSPPPGAVDDRVLWEVTRRPERFGGVPGGPKGGCGLGKGSRSNGPVGRQASAARGKLAVLEHWPVGGGRRLQRWELRRAGDAAAAVAGQRLPQPSGGWAVLGSGERGGDQACGPGASAVRHGDPPLDLVPVEVGDRFPVNFSSGFYRQPGRMSGPVPGRSSGSSVSIRAVARSQSRRSGRHERRWWRPS